MESCRLLFHVDKTDLSFAEATLALASTNRLSCSDVKDRPDFRHHSKSSETKCTERRDSVLLREKSIFPGIGKTSRAEVSQRPSVVRPQIHVTLVHVEPYRTRSLSSASNGIQASAMARDEVSRDETGQDTTWKMHLNINHGRRRLTCS